MGWPTYNLIDPTIRRHPILRYTTTKIDHFKCIRYHYKEISPIIRPQGGMGWPTYNLIDPTIYTTKRYHLSFAFQGDMRWLWLVASTKLYVSFAKEAYKRDDILQKRPIILSILLTVATTYTTQTTRYTTMGWL